MNKEDPQDVIFTLVSLARVIWPQSEFTFTLPVVSLGLSYPAEDISFFFYFSLNLNFGRSLNDVHF